MKTRRIHSREFKLDLCTRIEAGVLSKAQACRQHQLSPSMLDRWVEQYRLKGHASFAGSAVELDKDRRIAQLEQALGQAYLDIKVLQSALSKKGVESSS